MSDLSDEQVEWLQSRRRVRNSNLHLAHSRIDELYRAGREFSVLITDRAGARDARYDFDDGPREPD